MSKLKCPFCNSELVREGSNNYWCKKCNLERYSPALYGSQKLWQELIRTKKQLEIQQGFITKLYLNGNITDEQLERLKRLIKGGSND